MRYFIIRFARIFPYNIISIVIRLAKRIYVQESEKSEEQRVMSEETTFGGRSESQFYTEKRMYVLSSKLLLPSTIPFVAIKEAMF